MVLLFADTRYLMPTCRHQIKMDNERKEPICAQSAKGFAKHRPIYCPEPYGVMANYTLMTQHWSIIIWRIGKTVRAAFERSARCNSGTLDHSHPAIGRRRRPQRWAGKQAIEHLALTRG